MYTNQIQHRYGLDSLHGILSRTVHDRTVFDGYRNGLHDACRTRDSSRNRTELTEKTFGTLVSALYCSGQRCRRVCDLETPRNGLAIRTQLACDSLFDHLISLVVRAESPLSRIRHVKTREEAIRILVESLSCVREGDVEEEAHALFRWFRESQPTTQTSWSDVLNSKNELFRLTCVVVFLQFGQQATCINAFLMFSGSIWKRLEFDDPILFNIAWQITNVLAVSYVIIRTVLHDDDFVGRRARLLSRASVMGPALILVGLMYRIGDGDADSNSTYVSYVLLCFYAICYQITWGFSFREDIWGVFSQSEREKVTILALVIQSLTNFVVVASAPSLYTWSVEAMFYTFGTLNCFVFLLMYLSMVRGWKDGGH